MMLNLLRLLLYPFALLYGAIIWLRNRLYDSGFISSVAFSVPVISVGNLSVGGTGKTPHVEYLVRLLQYRFKVATMSRGYKRRTRGFLIAGAETNALQIGDEPMQYYRKFPELVVSVAEERMTGIPYLLQQQPEVDVILLDDAYQHRSVRAGMNILITDYNRPFYNDHILPYGRLRESRSAYRRADIVIVSKCPPQLTAGKAENIKRAIHPLSHQEVFFSCVRYGDAYDFFSGAPVSLEGMQVLLICGIASPGALIDEVEKRAAGVHVLSWNDHHYFSDRDLEDICETFEGWKVGNKLVLTTEKDAARLYLQKDTLFRQQIPVAVLPIEVELLFGQGPLFDRKLEVFTEQTIAEQHGTEETDNTRESMEDV
jgi:tetraacyldisaccharide 4'-kinase